MTKLGQHFLKDSRILQRIAEILEIEPGEIVIEVGPGHGELTRRLLAQKPGQLIAVEKDAGLIEKYLSQIAEENTNLKIIEGDALKKLPHLIGHSLLPTPYKLAGNIPYYITGYLLRLVGELEPKPKLIVFTLQKEVALRLCAEPPKMNLLAASVQFWGRPEIIRYISKKSFQPMPHVDSAIVKITPRGERVGELGKSYYPFIKTLFKQPRKTVLNNLREGLGADREVVVERLSTLGTDPSVRPQNLSVNQIKELARLFTRQN